MLVELFLIPIPMQVLYFWYNDISAVSGFTPKAINRSDCSLFVDIGDVNFFILFYNYLIKTSIQSPTSITLIMGNVD